MLCSILKIGCIINDQLCLSEGINGRMSPGGFIICEL